MTHPEFIALYVAEGGRRDRNQVTICNSDPGVMTLSVRWLRTLTDRCLTYTIQYHADQGLGEIRAFWGVLLDIEPEDIRLQRKSNSAQLAGRQWRSVNGVLTARVSDTMLRARLQAWIDLTKATWQ